MRSLKRFLAVLGEAVATAVLLAIYLVVVAGIGVAMRLMGRNPLRHEPTGDGFWRPHRGAADRKAMERQS